MGIFGGVTVTGFIAPSTTGDTYAVIDPIYGIDGLRSVADSTERNAITTLRRRHGMIVYQRDNDTYYKLLASPWTYTDTDWDVAFLSPVQIQSLIVSAITANEIVTYFSASTVGQTYFNSILPSTPTDLEKTKFFINGVKYRYDFDYVITGGTSVVWTGPFDLDNYDDMCMIYY